MPNDLAAAHLVIVPLLTASTAFIILSFAYCFFVAKKIITFNIGVTRFSKNFKKRCIVLFNHISMDINEFWKVYV